MELTLPATGADQETFDVLREEAGFALGHAAGELVFKLPERVGSGTVSRTCLREGLDLAIVDYESRERVSLKVEPLTVALEANFCLSGRCQNKVSGVGEEFVVGSGTRNLALLPETEWGLSEYPAGHRLRFVEVGLSPDALRGLFAEDLERMPPGFLALLEGRTEKPYFGSAPQTAAVRGAVEAILSCPFEGATRRVYLEAKALELLSLQLGAPPGSDSHPGEKQVRLRPEDVEMVRRAAEILFEEMDDPPSLLELSRRVAINDHKLKTGFKEVFGTTAFGYLRDRRMERAWGMLEEGEMSVGEVAASVGYANQGRFAEAFKQYFGLRPRDCRAGRLPYRSSVSAPVQAF